MARFQVDFFSQALGMSVAAEVIVPQYADGFVPPQGHKTLYLLHGLSDNHTIWGRRTSIERYVSSYGLAVVLPNGHVSGYANMVHGGRYFDYVADELPAVMRGFFALSSRREDNYIAGLSMGGAGAMKIGLARPERFSAIGCLSAGMSNHTPPFGNEKPEVLHRWECLYGGRDLTGTEEDPPSQAIKILQEHLPAPRVFHSCGSEDFLLPRALETKNFFESLPGNPFDYQYEQAPGAHQWEYWDEHIRSFLTFLHLPEAGRVRN